MSDVLTISNLKKGFVTPTGEQQLVIDVPHFSMQAGEHVALRGESGSGKTTLLHLIAGILSADSGSVVLDGTDMSRLSESARDSGRALKIGYIFQTFNLLQGYTALENVELGMRFGTGVDHSRAGGLLERVGLADRLHYKPSQMSVGQQQRVAVARALANEPVLVLADEPTGNLDYRRAKESLDLIRSVCEESGAALLLVSHDRQVLDAFDTEYDLTELNRAATLPSSVELDGGVA